MGCGVGATPTGGVVAEDTGVLGREASSTGGNSSIYVKTTSLISVTCKNFMSRALSRSVLQIITVVLLGSYSLSLEITCLRADKT